jgi:ankyrin repeat protein
MRVDLRKGKEEMTALMWASMKGQEACVELLLGAGAMVDLQEYESYTAERASPLCVGFKPPPRAPCAMCPVGPLHH